MSSERISSNELCRLQERDQQYAALEKNVVELLTELRAAKLEINSLRVSHELIHRFGPDND